MGYGPGQVRDLEATIAAVPCDAVVSGTPIDISRVLRMARPVARVRYDHADHGEPTLSSVLLEMLEERL
jgi:predicted GTPase